ncbi:MAG: chorismate-binding protein, partial [Brachymonas sp.]|nr:chorismate-binding protein [Brachymonas sp.]
MPHTPHDLHPMSPPHRLSAPDVHALSMVFDFNTDDKDRLELPQRLLFNDAKGIEIAWRPDEVLPALQRIEQAVQQDAWAAGYIAYEAAAGLDPSLAQAMRPPQGGTAHANSQSTESEQPSQMPLLALALFAGPGSDELDGVGIPNISGAGAAASNTGTPAPPFADGLPAVHPCIPSSTLLTSIPQWQLAESQAAYVEKVNRLRQAIAAGDLYQVNYTLRADARVPAGFSPWLYYEALRQRQQCRYGAFLNLGSHHILSLSPELFFDWHCGSGTITTRPMKGTAPRSATPQADAAQAATLQNSAKERAENVMIVDLLRNDLGRIAQTGSVHVPQLLHTEPYPTLWQMTSTVQATTRPGTTFTQVLQALFPCGSITGAPKHMAMQKIAAAEAEPRGVYCGAVGFFHKDRALFNVAIRTITHTPAPNGGGHLRCGTGGGITWP